MGGGLLQLVAYGAQDVYLTGNPQITFFKVVYRRHTNFSIESIEQDFTGTPDFNNKVTATISRNGDLIHQIWLECELPAVQANGRWSGYTNNIGHALIKEMEIEIGGQLIDKQYGEWLDIIDEITAHPSTQRMLSKFYTEQSLKDNGIARRVYVPLKFWFCNNPGLALPLIALQYHEVNISITFRPLAQLVKSNTSFVSPQGSISHASLWVDYIYLDTDERRKFAQSSHEYLIEQVAFTGNENITSSDIVKNVDLTLNHPVKSLHWVFVNDSNLEQNAVTGNNPLKYCSSSGGAPFSSMKLLFNGQNRFKERPEDYFRIVQHYSHYTRNPTKHIYTYSFALKPLEHQPSGTSNFSRIDNATMNFNLKDNTDSKQLLIFAVNYNILRVLSGMGGLAYSN